MRQIFIIFLRHTWPRLKSCCDYEFKRVGDAYDYFLGTLVNTSRRVVLNPNKQHTVRIWWHWDPGAACMQTSINGKVVLVCCAPHLAFASALAYGYSCTDHREDVPLVALQYRWVLNIDLCKCVHGKSGGQRTGLGDQFSYCSGFQGSNSR